MLAIMSEGFGKYDLELATFLPFKPKFVTSIHPGRCVV